MIILEYIFDLIISFFWWIILLPIVFILATPIIFIKTLFSELPYKKSIVNSFDAIVQYWKKYGVYFTP